MIAQISLPTTWDFRLDGDADWRPIPVPGCWEQIGVRKDISGPAWYRTRFGVPAELAGKRLWLRFDAVSYHCEIFVNGRQAGSHTGLWDAFTVEITGMAAPGDTAELLLRAEKPAGLTRGPDSESLPGRFPLRETLTGFLPYVWGHIFGGIWQDVTLVAAGPVVFEDALVRGTADGRVYVEAALSAPGAVALEIRDPDGTLILSATENTQGKEVKRETASVISVTSVAEHRVRFEVMLPDPRPWSPAEPALYQARLSVADGDTRAVRFGLRSLRAEGTAILLNERPLYPRMALSWGWYPEALNSNPGPERVRADFARLRRLGYNGVKLCLWFPPQYYFDLADELGMLLWVELPMWIPRPSPFFRQQAMVEYERLMRQTRGHPSVILYTLGCELNRAVGADLLGPLYATVKAHAGDALVRDNSGSGEAYGGLLNEFAEYYDHHFYSELQFLRGLLDHFTPRWRPRQPWVFGEFCDYDTFRDPRKLDDRRPTTDDRQAVEEPRTGTRRVNQEPNIDVQEKHLVTLSPCHLVKEDGGGQWSVVGGRPWWTLDDPEQNPQGARWIYEVVAHERRLRERGLWERAAELERISECQGILHRKYTLELVRLYQEVSGYVVTGEADTPISTAGMWDDGGRLKFDADEFRAFNGDLVALVGWDRRRAWVAGGDRAAPWDTWSYPSGATVRPHLIASHYGAARGPAAVSWAIASPHQPPFAAGQIETSFALTPGDLRELTIAEFAAPALDRPQRLTLSATVRVGHEQAANEWSLWVFPRDVWRGARGLALVDPTRRLRDLPQLAPQIDHRPPTTDHRSSSLRSSVVGGRSSVVVVATEWTPEVRGFVERGGRAVLLQAGGGPPGPLPTVELPFWREAIRLAAPHAAWRDFPLDDAMGMQFFGCAADCALDLTAFSQPWSPIFRRLDARTMALHEYAAEISWGAGRLIATTLRFEGGQGAQPLGLARNTAAAYLLWCWVTYLQTSP